MIIVKLWGGLCNQMFQYAFGYALSKEKGDKLFFDVDFFLNQPKYVTRRHIIDVSDFPNIKLEIINRPIWVKPFENKYISHVIRYNTGVNLPLINKNFLFMEKLHRYYSIIPYFIDSTNFYDGYWQTSKYFKPFREELLEIFSPSDIILKKVFDWRKSIDSSNTVAVHIRRGDYLNNINRNSLKGGNVIGDVDYYLSAIKIIKEKVKNPLFCFFSDDITWCKDTFSNKLDKVIIYNLTA